VILSTQINILNLIVEGVVKIFWVNNSLFGSGFGSGINWFRIAVTAVLYHVRSGVSDVVYPETGGGDWTDGQLTSGGSLQDQVSSLRTQLGRLQGTVDQVASGELQIRN
jgi:hypothetical protein